jgi:hypothetical protein
MYLRIRLQLLPIAEMLKRTDKPRNGSNNSPPNSSRSMRSFSSSRNKTISGWRSRKPAQPRYNKWSGNTSSRRSKWSSDTLSRSSS